MFFKHEHVEQSHVANIMLLRYTKSLALRYYTETTPLNPMRGNALKKVLCGKLFWFPHMLNLHKWGIQQAFEKRK